MSLDDKSYNFIDYNLATFRKEYTKERIEELKNELTQMEQLHENYEIALNTLDPTKFKFKKEMLSTDFIITHREIKSLFQKMNEMHRLIFSSREEFKRCFEADTSYPEEHFLNVINTPRQNPVQEHYRKVYVGEYEKLKTALTKMRLLQQRTPWNIALISTIPDFCDLFGFDEDGDIPLEPNSKFNIYDPQIECLNHTLSTENLKPFSNEYHLDWINKNWDKVLKAFDADEHTDKRIYLAEFFNFLSFLQQVLDNNYDKKRDLYLFLNTDFHQYYAKVEYTNRTFLRDLTVTKFSSTSSERQNFGYEKVILDLFKTNTVKHPKMKINQRYREYDFPKHCFKFI